jgi:hypothetical protein
VGIVKAVTEAALPSPCIVLGCLHNSHVIAESEDVHSIHSLNTSSLYNALNYINRFSDTRLISPWWHMGHCTFRYAKNGNLLPQTNALNSLGLQVLNHAYSHLLCYLCTPSLCFLQLIDYGTRLSELWKLLPLCTKQP